MSDVATLQSAINRFASVGGFPKVSVDGLWGTKTRQGVYSALAWIGQGKCYQNACSDEDTSRTAAGLIAQWDESAAGAKGLAEFLNGTANDLGIPLVASPIPPVLPDSGQVPQVPWLPTASIADRFKRLPMWQQVSLSVVAALGIIYTVNYISRRARR